jgi:predicted  nucleic acid-binding Zn-ribbon protein
VDPQAVDESTLPAGDVRSVEGNFKALWESARRAADVIAALREERQALQALVTRLERELQQVRAESAQFRKQTAEHVEEGGKNFAGGERDLLAAKVKELIAKLDAYL